MTLWPQNQGASPLPQKGFPHTGVGDWRQNCSWVTVQTSFSYEFALTARFETVHKARFWSWTHTRNSSISYPAYDITLYWWYLQVDVWTQNTESMTALLWLITLIKMVFHFHNRKTSYRLYFGTDTRQIYSIETLLQLGQLL